jgi:hypothetical protein
MLQGTQEQGGHGRYVRGFSRAMKGKLGNRGVSAISWLILGAILVVVFIIVWFLPPVVWTITLTIPVWILYVIALAIGFSVAFLLDREFDIGWFD